MPAQLKPREAHESPVAWLARVTKDEQSMASVSPNIVAKNRAKGMSIYLADSKGIYKLNEDGSKDYVEIF